MVFSYSDLNFNPFITVAVAKILSIEHLPGFDTRVVLTATCNLYLHTPVLAASVLVHYNL